jgi:hypothetical protein
MQEKRDLAITSLIANRTPFAFMNHSKGILSARNNKKVMFGCPLN